MLKPGDAAPPFDLPCALDDKLSRLSLASIRSEMVVLFFYPHDFSFICPTESDRLSQVTGRFQGRTD